MFTNLQSDTSVQRETSKGAWVQLASFQQNIVNVLVAALNTHCCLEISFQHTSVGNGNCTCATGFRWCWTNTFSTICTCILEKRLTIMTTHLCTINMCALYQFGDELLLNQLCYMATGIKQLLISPDGGRWKLRNGDLAECKPGSVVVYINMDWNNLV